MKLPSAKLVPAFITLGVLALMALLQAVPRVFPSLHLAEDLEGMSYDWRVRLAAARAPAVATNLGFVAIDDSSLEVVNKGFGFAWPWPRKLHGFLVQELKAQRAKAIGFDIFFAELQPPNEQTDVNLGGGVSMSSDSFFARKVGEAGNVVLAAKDDVLPDDLFRTNALAIGDISTDPERDGVLRRAHVFKTYRLWLPQIRYYASSAGLDLSNVRIEDGRIKFCDSKGQVIRDDQTGKPLMFPLGQDGKVDPALFEVKPSGAKPAPPFTEVRVFHLAVLLAAQALGLDLSKTTVEPGRVILRGKDVERVIPVGKDGLFYINWAVDVRHPQLHQGVFQGLIDDARRRANHEEVAPRWQNKIVVVGSLGTGNNIVDIGATPLGATSYLVSKHWNVANQILIGRFISRSGYGVELLLILALGLASAAATWKLPPPWPTVWGTVGAAVYTGLAVWLYMQFQYWIPMVLPLTGSLLCHVGLVTYQVVFEQREKRRVKGVFERLVSPNIVHELLRQKKLNLGGSRRNITVLFADVRGFTAMTDEMQAKAVQYVADHNLTGEAAEAHFDRAAAETLETVNVYLATIADQIKKRDGTLDKYIGDCVMAFWGAPLPNERHAVDCVKTAMDAQRAMYSLNLRRAEQNKQREAENPARIAAGQPPLEMLPLLSLGTGINSGIAIVGLMGSSEHIISYTVFGREVNLASRLEGVSGRGRIIIGESTYLDLKKYEPQLAAIAVELAPVQVKGIKQAVKIYEVPWKPASIPNPAAPEAPKPEPAKAEPTPAGVAAPSTPKPVGLDATTFVPKTEPAAPAAPAAASSPGQTKPVGLDAT